ncbi:MAG: hypothetical protein AAF907_06630, partial [Planctomycetota bacterium]
MGTVIASDSEGHGLPAAVVNIGGKPNPLRGFTADAFAPAGLPYHRGPEFMVLPAGFRRAMLLRNPLVRALARRVWNALADAPAEVADPRGLLKLLPPAPSGVAWERCGAGTDGYRAGKELVDRFGLWCRTVETGDGFMEVKFLTAASWTADRAEVLHGRRADERQFAAALRDRRAAAGEPDRRTPPAETLARVRAVWDRREGWAGSGSAWDVGDGWITHGYDPCQAVPLRGALAATGG